jgi:tRNA(fMet)-specific endonuclease VapC
MIYLLDTDHVSLLDRGGSEAARIQARIAGIVDGMVAVAVVSYEEQMRGWMSFLAGAQSIASQVERYQRLERLLDYYCRTRLLPFDEAAAEQFQRLWIGRPRIGTMDLKIAAIALANDALLLTRNTRDFDKVPGLRHEDWTV